jgi:hypothetical protein
MDKGRVQDGVVEYSLDHWREFHTLCEEEFLSASAYVYRGQADYTWPLESTLDRLTRRFPRRKNMSGTNPKEFGVPPLTDAQHLAAFKRATRGRLGINRPALESEDEWWAMGQHHGLATPLLDCTRSAYVSLFFALEEELPQPSTEPEHRGVYAFSTSLCRLVRPKSSDEVYLVSPSAQASYRLVSQAAVLLRLPKNKNLESYVRDRCKDEPDTPSCMSSPCLIKVKIRATDDERHQCLAALDKMNINRMSLFPDVDGAAKYVNSLWEPFHENLLGFEGVLCDGRI